MTELEYPVEYGTVNALYFKGKGAGMPLIAEIHGGGFCEGRAADDMALCQSLADLSGFNVVALDYRLAPRNAYPAAIEDCCNILAHMRADDRLDFDRSKVFVLGHSAGANLALAVVARQGGAAGIALDYPWLDLYQNRRKRVFLGIPRAGLALYAHRYCRDRQLRRQAELSPLYMGEEQLSKLPPALVITAGKDTLKPDGEAFAALLKSAGVRVEYTEYADAGHGFVEIAASGRMKRGLFRSQSSVERQLVCYKKALAEIADFFSGLCSDGNISREVAAAEDNT